MSSIFVAGKLILHTETRELGGNEPILSASKLSLLQDEDSFSENYGDSLR